MIESHLAHWETSQISIFLMPDWLKVSYLGLICRSLTSSSEDVFRHDPINPLFQAFLVGGVSPFGMLLSVITKPAAVKFTQLRLPSGTCWNLIVVMPRLGCWSDNRSHFFFLKASDFGLYSQSWLEVKSLSKPINRHHSCSSSQRHDFVNNDLGLCWRAYHCCLGMQMACC